MKDGPDIARLAALIGDPARANMLTALMSGKALTSTELALEAGVTLQTASSHLARLTDGGLIRPRKQGRHRYYSLGDDEVGAVLESLMGLAARRGHLRTRTGPKDPALRRARVCYDHMAGDCGVQIHDSLLQRGFLAADSARETLTVTEAGLGFLNAFGLAMHQAGASRRPLCRPCLDWSERRNHLAGRVGAAVLDRLYSLEWVRRDGDSRVLTFTPTGEREFRSAFPVD